MLLIFGESGVVLENITDGGTGEGGSDEEEDEEEYEEEYQHDIDIDTHFESVAPRQTVIAPAPANEQYQC